MILPSLLNNLQGVTIELNSRKSCSPESTRQERLTMKSRPRLLWTAPGAIALITFVSITLFAQQGFKVSSDYTKTEVMIPMRDGVELFTAIYEPTDQSQTYPVMFFRTPYGIGNYGPEIRRHTLGPSPLFTSSGYIFVYQDVRGKYRSEGKFEVMNPVYSRLIGPERTDETTDTYDAIEWVLKNVPNHNGRVGQWGISYPGWQTVMGMIDAHLALVAASPQASPADMFIGDDFHHNGAFRLMYTFSWLAGNAAVRTAQSSSNNGTSFSSNSTPATRSANQGRSDQLE